MVRQRLLKTTIRIGAGLLVAALLAPSATFAGGWHHRQKGHLVAIPVGQGQPSATTPAAAFPMAQPAASFSYAMPVAQPTYYTYTTTPVQASYTIAAPAAPAASYQIVVAPTASAAAPQPSAGFTTTPTSATPNVHITVIESPQPAPAASAPAPQTQQPIVPITAPATGQQVQLFFVPCHRCSIFCKH